jgi:membrane protein DedA with SNARE-associated domain
MFDWITRVIERLGYLGVAALTFLENVFPPIPSELVIPLAGFVAAQGELRLWIVIAAGTAGSLAGATMWYLVGRNIGERRVRSWVDRFGKWITLSGEDLDRAQQWFERHGTTAVFAGRLVPGIRTFISLPAGFTRMPLGAFLAYSFFGTAIWTAALACAGVVLRANFTRVGDAIDVVTYILLGLAAAFMVRRYLICWRAAARRAHDHC